MRRLWRLTAPRERSRGQGLVELAILVPAFLILLLGMLEFGFVFSHHLTLEYATREGARVGAALGKGTKVVACDPNAAENVDYLVIAAVQRVLTSPGSQIAITQIQSVKIFKSTSSGTETVGSVNTWVPGNGPTVDGTVLQFARTGQQWNACTRRTTASSTQDADSIGVSLVYDYRMITPLATMIRWAGGGTIRVSDVTVMALNPFQDP